MVAFTMTEDQASFQKLLVGWWTEEAEYLLQRIERWTLPRRYNKLHSPRISRGRMTMQKNEIDDSIWSCSSSRSNSSKSSQENFSSIDEIRKINCSRTVYQSNSRFDSSCLENYRYDHSIYFKTIGDIKNSKNKNELNNSCEAKTCKDLNDNNCDLVLENNPEDDVHDIQDRPAPTASLSPDQCWNNYSQFNMDNNNNNNSKINNKNNDESNEMGKIFKSWPIVDIENLTNYKQNPQEKFDDNNNNDNNQQLQNQMVQSAQLSSSPILKNRDRADLMRILSFCKSRRTKTPQQPVVYGDNNISWPRVLFNYNVDSTLAASHHRTLNVK